MAEVSASSVQAALETALPGARVAVTDTSGGCGAAFEVSLVWAGFADKPRLARHRAVTAALQPLMSSIHALSITKTKTPAEEEEGGAATPAAPAEAAAKNT